MRCGSHVEIAADDNDITIDAAGDRGAPAENDQRCALLLAALENEPGRIRLDQAMGLRDRGLQESAARARSRRRDLDAGLRPCDSRPQQHSSGKADLQSHRASSRKFFSKARPSGVMTDSGWNCTPHTGCARCRTA